MRAPPLPLLLLGLLLHRGSPFHVGGQRTPSHAKRRAVGAGFVRAQATPPGLEGASKLLTKLLTDAYSRMKANPDEPIRLKMFNFTAGGKHAREVVGDDVISYLTLPVEEYALFDAKMMRRVDGETFELSVPLGGLPSASNLQLCPTVRVRVTQDTPNSLTFGSVSTAAAGPDARRRRVTAASPPRRRRVAAASPPLDVIAAQATPVVDGEGRLMGMLKYRDVVKAAQAGKGSQQVKAWMRRDVVTLPETMPLSEVEAVLIAKQAGRLPVVDRAGVLRGLVTRTDVLRQHKLYGEQLTRRVA